MKTLLLAAGGGGAFTDAGHTYPKNLVEVAGLPLLGHVLGSLGGLATGGQLVAVVPREEALRFHTPAVLRLLEPTVTVVEIGPTAGAACSALLAAEHLPAEEPLLVVGGDQVLDVDVAQIVAGFADRGLAAGVVTFDAVHPRWSYVRLEDDRVVEASEKRPISRHATTGCYWFRRAGDFVDAAMAMIRKGASVEGQYFVCPALNELVLAGAQIGVHPVPRSAYHSLHDPQGVAGFEAHLQARSGVAA